MITKTPPTHRRSLEMRTQPTTDYWTAMGRYLGYPDCCVATFIERNKPSAMQCAAGQRTGFIPCHAHTLAVLSAPNRERWRVLCSLIMNRAHDAPFPRLNRHTLGAFKDQFRKPAATT